MTTAFRLMSNHHSNPTFHAPPDPLEHGTAPPFRTLELAGVLQTTLDLSELMDLFLHEMQVHIELDGIAYRNQERGLEIKKGDTFRHSLSYDLTVKGQRLGEISFHRQSAFQSDEIRTLEDLLAALLYPLRNTLEYQRALQSALIDSLTGVNNRAAMDVVLRRELELARRRKSSLTVILIDVDYFKQVNDTYGHPVGDLCLQALAHCVEDSIRGSDMLFRAGGEEFLVLLSQTGRKGAEQLAERVRRRVQELRLIAIPGRALSVSLGVAELTPTDTVDSLYARADQALYEAKQAGRNRVHVL
jgi:diguanylate cyclase (GGDEF)-like protein